MTELRAYSIEQPALAVADLDLACDRMHALFGALPSERMPDYNAVYAFGNNTHLELLGPVSEEHTRARFVRRNGPGFYMICATLENQDVAGVGDTLARLGKRVVRSMEHRNVRKTWHIHPHDAGGLLILLAVRTDLDDNAEYAGSSYRAYIKGNTRWCDEVHGVIARSAEPAADAAVFAPLGFAAQPQADGCWRWQGRAGTILEFRPSDAWRGAAVTERRDYALCLRARSPQALVARFAAAGLVTDDEAGGRWLSAIDPVLGVRFAVEPLPQENR
jgi:hypothetical protein